MSKRYYLTPEEVMRKKKMKKNIMYASIFIFTVILSAFVTFLTNSILSS